MKQKSSVLWTRRGFLHSSLAAGAAFSVVPRRVLGAPGIPSANEQLTKAVIGVGGMGRGHVKYDDARLLAVCDADAKHLQQVVDAEPGVKGYRDFREVLARPDIDVIHIATPPHWHALMSIAAAEAGKDIWCEKPMSRTIAEGRAVIEAVHRNARMFRLNTWFRFQAGYYGYGTAVAPIKKLVDSGLLGWPLTVRVGEETGFSWKFGWSGRTDLKPEPVPPELDYDLWLGPAPYKPYHPHRTHGTFRGYWDYDGGGLGDMGQHYLDPVQYLLGKDDTAPVHAEADAPLQHPDAASSFRRITLTYADGCKIVLLGSQREPNAPFIEGPKGKLYKNLECTVPGARRLIDALPDPDPQLTDFPTCVRTRRKFALNEENGHRSCTIVNLAITTWRLGRAIRFDPVTERVVGDEDANRLICQPMRAPWHI